MKSFNNKITAEYLNETLYPNRSTALSLNISNDFCNTFLAGQKKALEGRNDRASEMVRWRNNKN